MPWKIILNRDGEASIVWELPAANVDVAPPSPRTVGRRAPREVVKCPKCARRFVNLRGVEVHLARVHKEG